MEQKTPPQRTQKSIKSLMNNSSIEELQPLKAVNSQENQQKIP